MRNHIFNAKLATALFFPALMAACNSNSLLTTPQHDTSAVITAANVSVATGETTTIMDLVTTVAPVNDSLLGITESAVSCSSLGYSGNGTATVSGSLQEPGDRMTITYHGCTIAGYPMAGSVGVTLDSKFQNDDGEGFATSFTYQGFTLGSGENLFTVDGTVSVQGNYDYQTQTMTTTRNTTTLKLTQPRMSISAKDLTCIETYTGLWDTGPFTMECDIYFDSASLGGYVSVETLELLRGIGGENRPTSGMIQISGAQGSLMQLIPQSDGENALVKWDEDGDVVFEGQVFRTWTEIKLDMLNWHNLFM